jgi:hypothetical protein
MREDANNINKEVVNLNQTLEQVVLGSIPSLGLTSETFSNRNNDRIKTVTETGKKLFHCESGRISPSQPQGRLPLVRQAAARAPANLTLHPDFNLRPPPPNTHLSFVPPGTSIAQHAVLCSKPRRGIFHGMDSPLRCAGQLLDNRASPVREPHASQRPDPANSQAQCLCHQCYPYRLTGCMGCSHARGARGRRA